MTSFLLWIPPIEHGKGSLAFVGELHNVINTWTISGAFHIWRIGLFIDIPFGSLTCMVWSSWRSEMSIRYPHQALRMDISTSLWQFSKLWKITMEMIGKSSNYIGHGFHSFHSLVYWNISRLPGCTELDSSFELPSGYENVQTSSPSSHQHPSTLRPKRQNSHARSQQRPVAHWSWKIYRPHPHNIARWVKNDEIVQECPKVIKCCPSQMISVSYSQLWVRSLVVFQQGMLVQQLKNQASKDVPAQNPGLSPIFCDLWLAHDE